MQAERKPDGVHFPHGNAKKRPSERAHAQGGRTHHASFVPPIPPGVIVGLARLICAHEEYSPPSRLIAWGVQFRDHVP